MQTQTYKYANYADVAVASAVAALNNGGIIAYPTETVYGLGVDMFNSEAVDKCYDLKNRKRSKPLSVNICSLDQVNEVCSEVPPSFRILASKFLPGPLTIILKKKDGLPEYISSGFDTIAVRFPESESLLRIIRKFGKPIAGTSANLSGKRSSTNAQEVEMQFNGKIDVIIDGGRAKLRSESTIISLAEPVPKIIRRGAVPVESIAQVLGIYL